MDPTRLQFPTASLTVFLLACSNMIPSDKDGGEDSGGELTDSGADSATDTGRDSGKDSGEDSGPDTGNDSGSDSGGGTSETGTDTGADTGADSAETGSETGVDSGDDTADSAADTADTSVDTGDSGMDTGDTGSAETGDTGDTGTDTDDSGTDSSTDSGDTGDTNGDSGGDTAETGSDTDDSGPDSGDTAFDTAFDTGSDTAADTGSDTGTAEEPDPPPVTFDFAVCIDGSADYTDIQDAIDAASPGDSISVCPGTYGPIYVPWAAEVYVTSTDGRDVTTIDGGLLSAVIVDNGTLTLSGFHVTGTSLDDGEGAAFSVHEGDLTVSDSRVADTTGHFTVLFDENYLAMDDVEWENNTTGFLWYFVEGINADVHHNTVRGGTHETVVATPDLDNALVTNNLFIDVQISSGFTAFDFTSNGEGELGIYNNIFYNVDDDDPWGGRVLDLVGVDFRNNIVTQCDAWNLRPMEADYNLFWDNNVDYSAQVSGTGNLYVDPQFTNAASEDFSLQASSPAIDAGDPAASFNDADGSVNDIGQFGGRDGEVDADSDTDSDTDADSDADTDADVYTLTVTNGYGDGSYAVGEVVHVWADADPQSQIVTGWSGGTLTYDAEWNSEFTMPAANTNLVPTIESGSLPLVETSYTLAGTLRTVLYAIPSSPRGIVLYFHSASGNHSEIKDNGPSSVARRLYDAGFGVVAMDSDIGAIAGSGGWSDSQDDETLDLAATRELMVELAYWGTPVIAWGSGSGGQFAHAVGLGLPADAVISYCAPGRRYLVESTDAPTAWFLAERDSTYTSAEDDVARYVAALALRGVETEVHVHPPTPLYAERFERVSGVSSVLSASIAAGLLADGYVDIDGNWLVTGEDAVDNLGGYGLSYDDEQAVAREIRIMAADGSLYDDYSAETLDFISTLFP